MDKAVWTRERALGDECFEENRGHFWGVLETRPYMRAQQELADLLRDAGRTDEAIAHYEAMLDLNPNDNQGIRDLLLACCLTRGHLDGARRQRWRQRQPRCKSPPCTRGTRTTTW